MVDDRFFPAPDSAGNKCFPSVATGGNHSILSINPGTPTTITCATSGGWLSDADGEDSPDGVILSGLSGSYAVYNGMMVRTRNVRDGGLTFDAYYDHSGMLPSDTPPYGFMGDGEGLETSNGDMGKNPLNTSGFGPYTGGGVVSGRWRRIEQLDEVSTTSDTDQKIIQGSGQVGADTVGPRVGNFFLRDTIYYNKPYDINGRESTGNLKGGNSGNNKPRSQMTMSVGFDQASNVEAGEMGRAGISIYLPTDYADENGTSSGDSRNMFMVLGIDGGGAGHGNFGVGNPGGDIPTTDIFGNSTPTGAGNVWVWRERFSATKESASNNLGEVWWWNLGPIAEDKGKWTDFVWEHLWNPFAVTTNAKDVLPNGYDKLLPGGTGILRIWKGTGEYLPGTQNRIMKKMFDQDDHPDHPGQTGTVPTDDNFIMHFQQRQYRFGWHRKPTTTRDPVAIGVDEVRVGAENLNGTQYEDVHPTAQPALYTKKWNPGHYIKTQGNPTNFDTAGYWSGVQSTISNRVNDIPELKGAFVAIAPGMVNTAPGTYDWSDLDATLAQLKTDSKRIIIDLTWKSFNDATPGLHAPPDLSAEIEPTGTGWIWAVWRESNMDRLIEIYEAMAARYDSDPNVELITSAETAPSFSGSQPADYSVSKYIVQLKRLYTACSIAFRETIWAPNMNSLGGDDMDELFEHMYQTSGAVAFPDWGKGRAAQLFDGRNTSTVVDREFRGQIAAHGIVSTNKLNDAGVTPDSIFQEQLTHQATHFSWITSASGEDSWPNILQAIQNNELIGTVTTCPTRFGGCK
jgi:hypothetical protein